MNIPLSPKQQEIRDREKAILSVAGRFLDQEGYASLSMDRIAAELRYAKGTIYNHFPNKEEIILALAVQAIQTRQELFQRACEMKGSSRDRIQAVGIAFEFYIRNNPQHFKVEQVIRHDSIWGKTSQQRRDLMLNCEISCMQMLASIVQDGIEDGDIDEIHAGSIEEMLFGLWALTYGSYVLHATSPSLSILGVHDVFKAVRSNSSRMMNGIGWRPLRQLDEDLGKYERVAQELFPDQIAKLQSSNRN